MANRPKRDGFFSRASGAGSVDPGDSKARGPPQAMRVRLISAGAGTETDVMDEATATEEVGTTEEAPKEAPQEAPKESTEAQIARQALEAVEDKSDAIAKEADVEVGKVTAHRATRRALKAEIAALDAEAAAKRQAAQAPAEVELSPLEKFVEEHPDDVVPAKLHLAEANWQRKQQAADRAKQDTTKAAEKARTDLGAAFERGKKTFSLFEQVTEDGEEHLTKGDRVDIIAAEQPEVELYERCVHRILKHGGTAAVTLRQQLQKQAESAKKPATEPKEKEPGGSTEEKSTKPSGGGKALARMERIFDM